MFVRFLFDYYSIKSNEFRIDIRHFSAIIAVFASPRGGIGRRAWFRSMCREVWGFESLRGHHIRENPVEKSTGFFYFQVDFSAIKSCARPEKCRAHALSVKLCVASGIRRAFARSDAFSILLRVRPDRWNHKLQMADGSMDSRADTAHRNLDEQRNRPCTRPPQS